MSKTKVIEELKSELRRLKESVTDPELRKILFDE